MRRGTGYVVIIIAVLASSVMLVVIALRALSRDGGPKRYLAISMVPVLLTIVLPVPLILRPGGPTDWARGVLQAISVIGVVLSFILLTVGAVLTLRASRAGDRQGAMLLALETALAGLPAGIVMAYGVMYLLI